MARTRFDDWPCSVARTVDRISDPWALLILRDAFYGVRRFEAFQQNLSLARNVLTRRLADLVDAGIFDRVPYQDRPVRHEYRLTEKGRALYDVVLAIMRFGDDWLAPDGPPIVLRDRDTDEVIRPRVVDEATGRPIDPRRVRVEAGPGFPDEHRDRAAAERRFSSD